MKGLFRSTYIIAVISLLFATSCKEQEKILQSISGKAGEIAVVTNKVDWEGEIGKSIRTVLAQEFPYLPQIEPAYSLVNVPPQAFVKVFQVHRNILHVSLDDNVEKADVKLYKDVWATPQTVVKVTAKTTEDVANIILANGEKIFNMFEVAERERVILNAKEFEDASIAKTISAKFGGSPTFPKGYIIKKDAKDFMWISYETTYTNQSVLFYKFPYENTSSLSQPFLAQKRNEVTHIHIPCTTENSYMIINPMIQPGYKMLSFNGRNIVEMRGLWEAYNDYMGGPYISHTFLSPDGKDVIVMDAFVYAPKFPKRNYIKQMESLLYSFSWENKEQ
jgi:hypothetical protein